MSYFTKNIDLAPQHIPAELIEDNGENAQYVLKVQVQYVKSASQRGIVLSLSRHRVANGSETYMPFAKYNGRVLLHPMNRKNDKKGREVAAAVVDRLDRIAEIATESETPDFNAIKDIFEGAFA